MQAANGEALSGLSNLMISNSGTEVLHKIDILRRRTQVSGERVDVAFFKGLFKDTADDLRRMEQEQEAFALQYHECTKINGEWKNCVWVNNRADHLSVGLSLHCINKRFMTDNDCKRCGEAGCEILFR